jgi:hypothetical protein
MDHWQTDFVVDESNRSPGSPCWEGEGKRFLNKRLVESVIGEQEFIASSVPTNRIWLRSIALRPGSPDRAD